MIPRRILAIATQTARSAVRSRALPSLALLLLGTVLAIPLLVQSDGTLGGRIQIVIQYCAGAATAILSVATLWASSGTIAAEIEDRPLFLVLSKPVSRLELWLGKWLAIVGMNLVLLAAVGLIVFAMVQRIVRSSPAGDPERLDVERYLLTAQEAVKPLQSASRGEAPTACAVPPGGSLHLEFPRPRDSADNARFSLSYTFIASRPERRPVVCEWTFLPDNAPPHLVVATNYAGLRHVIDIPAAAAGVAAVKVCLVNTRTADAATIVFDPDAGGLELLASRSGFGSNLFRALLIAWLRLAFIAALGVSAGCLFSMPVALFVSAAFLIVLLSAGYIQYVSAIGMFYVPHEGGAPEMGAVERLTLHMFTIINKVTEPLLELDGVAPLAAGRWISGTLVAKAFGTLLGLYTVTVAALGVLAFRRREVGLF